MTDYEKILRERLGKHIVLKDGAPPLEELSMQFVMRERMHFDKGNYLSAERANSATIPCRIGHDVENILDAVNEERLMLIHNDTSPYDILGFDDAEPSVDTNWDFQLVDEEGTVWSELVDAPDRETS